MRTCGEAGWVAPSDSEGGAGLPRHYPPTECMGTWQFDLGVRSGATKIGELWVDREGLWDIAGQVLDALMTRLSGCVDDATLF